VTASTCGVLLDPTSFGRLKHCHPSIPLYFTFAPVVALTSGSFLFIVVAACNDQSESCSYPSDCSIDKVTSLKKCVVCIHAALQVDLWPSAGVNQMFQFIPAQAIDDGSMFQYTIVAVGRSACPLKFLSFPVSCTTQSPDLIDLWDAAGPEQTFRLIPISASQPSEVFVNTEGPCADPFVWFDPLGVCVLSYLQNVILTVTRFLQSGILSSAQHQTSHYTHRLDF
jgi:hypothetical protein